MMRRFSLMFALALALCASSAARLCAQQVYTLTDIGPWPTGVDSLVGINASGAIAGSTGSNAFLWTPSSPNSPTGTFSLLPVPSGTTSSGATGINASGQIVGARAYTVTGKHHKTSSVTVAVLWQPGGACVDLTGGQANAINDAGEIVGTFGLWVNGNIYPLPGPPSLWPPMSINNSGQVTGFLGSYSTGYLWTPSAPNGTTGTSITLPFNGSQVNNLGDVVGMPWWEGNTAALYTPSSGVQYLAAVNASGINNLGQVVGHATGAYIWDSVHGVRNLQDTTQFTLNGAAGWQFWSANFINDKGQIVGVGWNPAGARRIWLLTPQ
jgi:uncharacterized membrane protein